MSCERRKEPLRVHLLGEWREDLLDPLQEALEDAVALTSGPDLPSPPDHAILVAGRPRREHLDGSPRLGAVVVPWAGIPEGTRSLLAEFPGIALHNLHHNAVPTAELAFALLLAAAKKVVPMDRRLRAGDWGPRYEDLAVPCLEGMRCLVLGHGAVGSLVARFALAFGMRVEAVRRRIAAPAEEGPIRVHPADALPRLLPGADAVVIALPLTPETRGLLGRREIGLLPPGAILVNIGRGPIVDEEVLFEALRDGRLGGAGLDVWYEYPKDESERGSTPPSRFPFGELENVVLSPHRAGSAAGTERLRALHLARLLSAAARGEEIPNRVDLAAGY